MACYIPVYAVPILAHSSQTFIAQRIQDGSSRYLSTTSIISISGLAPNIYSFPKAVLLLVCKPGLAIDFMYSCV